MTDLTWMKWMKDLSAQRRWKTLIHCERKDKTGKNVDVLNLTRNSRLCSCHFDMEKISTDSYTSGDPVCFAWTNWKKHLVWGGPECHRSAKPRKSTSAAPLHVTIHGTHVASITSSCS